MIAETNDYVGEALIGLEVCQALGLPAMVTFASVQPEDDLRRLRLRRGVPDPGRPRRGDRGPELLARPGDHASAARGIRAAVDIAVAAQPVPYRTSPATPAFEELASADGSHLFPIQLEPFQCTRFEMADFARRARDIGVDYIGICCGGGPHHVRAMAEALGRETPASRYSPELALHPVLGTPHDEGRHKVMRGWDAES